MDFTTANLLTIISLVMGFGVTVLQIYVSARLAKIKEEVLETMRKELQDIVKELENKMVTNRDLDAFRQHVMLMLENIKLQIKNANRE
jgi:beta-lactamase regulating signal transducer with metallopeptidase domain